MAKNILHMVTPLAHMSPFDVNMAIDAGYDATAPYANVSVEGDHRPRPGRDVFAIAARRSAYGRVHRRKGCFSRARHARRRRQGALETVRDFAVRRSGRLVHHRRGDDRRRRKSLKEKKGRSFAAPPFRFSARPASWEPRPASSPRSRARLSLLSGMMEPSASAATPPRSSAGSASIWPSPTVRPPRAGGDPEATEVALCAARAGVRVLDASRSRAARLLIAADVNAVPPLGIEGVDLQANGAPLGEHGALGVGALAIGNVKYRTEFGSVQANDREQNRPAPGLPPSLRIGADARLRRVSWPIAGQPLMSEITRLRPYFDLYKVGNLIGVIVVVCRIRFWKPEIVAAVAGFSGVVVGSLISWFVQLTFLRNASVPMKP